MHTVRLPISKSIANRLLILQALHGDPLLGVSDAYLPEDVRTLHDALLTILSHKDSAATVTLNVRNCGTAMRFLTAFCARLPSPATFILDGDPRLRQRPIAQEVDALRQLGADIIYIGTEGFPPLRINGKHLSEHRITTTDTTTFLQSTQFVSALLLIGKDVQTNDPSPYIRMTRRLIALYEEHSAQNSDTRLLLERDWSSAAFWYEYIALHGGEIFLQDLQPSTLQGDQCVADLFEPLGVQTRYLNEPQQKGVMLSKTDTPAPKNYTADFSDCPDLYPALAITCERLRISLQAQGTERLPFKESNRLQSVKEHRPHHDHRIAMALLAADLPCDDTLCIAKSYPDFLQQLNNIKHPIQKEVS